MKPKNPPKTAGANRVGSGPFVRPCAHRRTWVVNGGHGEWCYECGAFRALAVIRENQSAPRTTWVRPTGAGGENPWKKMREIRKA